MKTLILFFISLLSFSASYSQEGNLLGTWQITDCTYVTKEGTRKNLEAEIKNGKAVCDLFFMKDGKYKMISNMTESGTMETNEGSWKIKGNKLILTLVLDGVQRELVNTFKQKNNNLITTNSSPDEKMRIINTFKRK